jgi:hypothetical protein
MANVFMKPLHNHFNARQLRSEIEGVDRDWDNTDSFMVADEMPDDMMMSFTSPFGHKKKVKSHE